MTAPLEQLPLAEDFVHVSPQGLMKGRQKYLEKFIPLAAENPAPLKTHRVIGDGAQAAVHFEMRTRAGVRQCCDWVRVAHGEIVEVISFYDARGLGG